jgi:hypothetical protein
VKAFQEPGAYQHYRERWRTWSLRAFALGFTALAMLAVAHAVRHDKALRITFKAIASFLGIAMVALEVLSYSYAIRFRRVRRREGGGYWR